MTFVDPTLEDGEVSKGTDKNSVCEVGPAVVQIGPIATVTAFPTLLNPAAPSRVSDPGTSQLPLPVPRGAQLTNSRLERNISVSASGQVPVLLADPQDSRAPNVNPKLMRSGSSGLASFNGIRLNVQGGNASGRGTALLAAAAAPRTAAASPSFRRQPSGGVGGSFRRQPNGGAITVVHSVAFSDPGSTNTGGGHVLAPYGEGSNSFGSHSHSGHDRGNGGLRGDAGDGGRRRGWLRGLFCFGSRSPERLAGYHGQDDLAVVAMQHKEALQVRKSTSKRLSKAVSDTFMVRSSRPGSTAAVASPAAANICPGSPGRTRKLQPMLSLQPHKSILKSSSLKRKVGEVEPILVKVTSARVVVGTPELTNTVVTTAADAAGDYIDSEELGTATSSAFPGVLPAGDVPCESVPTDSAATTSLNTAGSSGPNIKGGCDMDNPLEGTSVANGSVLVDSVPTAAVEAAAVVARADDPSSQTRTTGMVGNLPSSRPMSPLATGGRLDQSIRIVTKANGTTAGAVGWFPESPGQASGAASPAATNGGRVLLKSMSLQHTIQARLAGIIGTNASSSVDAAGSGALSSVASGASGQVMGTSASGAPIIGNTGGLENGVGGSGGGSGDEGRPSLVQRMMTRQASRGHGSGFGGSSSSSGVAGGNLLLGRATPRNAVLPLPNLVVGTGGTGSADGNIAEGSSPLSPTPRRVASLRRPVPGDPPSSLTGGTQFQISSYPSSPSHHDSQVHRRLPGKSSKLAAGINDPGEQTEEDGVDNPFYGRPDRVTSPGGKVVERLATPKSATAGDPRQRRLTTGGLAVDSDNDDGDDQAMEAAAAMPSRHRLHVTRSMRERNGMPYLTSESPQLAQPEAASLHPSGVVTPYPVLEGCSGSITVGVPPGQVEDLAPVQADSGSTARAGHKKHSMAGADNGGYKAPNTVTSSSTSSLEDYMTSIAASLRATNDPESAGGDMNDSDDEGDDVHPPARWRMGIDGERTSVGRRDFDTRQTRRMVAAELLRMRSLGVEPGVQPNHLEAEFDEKLELGAQAEFQPPDQLLQRQQPQPVLPEELSKPDSRKDAPVPETPVDASDSLGPLATTGGDEASRAARASGRDTPEAPAATPSSTMRYRLKKFHSLGHGAFRSSYGASELQAQPQQQEPSDVPLTPAMLRASAAAALDNLRRVKGAGAAAGPLAAASTIVADANATPDDKYDAEGATTRGGAKNPLSESTHMFTATPPRDSLESWVRNQSRRSAADRAGVSPLGALDPLDELTEVTGFGTATTAAMPAPSPPPAQVGEPTPASMPFLWGAGSQSLHRSIRLAPEPEVLQMWLHRNDRNRAQRQTALQQDQRGNGVGAAPTVPVLRQSLPGNVRFGAQV